MSCTCMHGILGKLSIITCIYFASFFTLTNVSEKDYLDLFQFVWKNSMFTVMIMFGKDGLSPSH